MKQFYMLNTEIRTQDRFQKHFDRFLFNTAKSQNVLIHDNKNIKKFHAGTNVLVEERSVISKNLNLCSYKTFLAALF